MFNSSLPPLSSPASSIVNVMFCITVYISLHVEVSIGGGKKIVDRIGQMVGEEIHTYIHNKNF